MFVILLVLVEFVGFGPCVDATVADHTFRRSPVTLADEIIQFSNLKFSILNLNSSLRCRA